MAGRFRISAPALVVMMRMTLRKSALRPLLSVSVPWSMTCSRILKISGCAFSISSSSSTQCGCLVMASVSRPPWSNPTYPGGAPIRRETAWRSMYSDISKRSSSMPMVNASWRATSVLPTPVGPENRKAPMGLSGLPNPERAILMAAVSAPMASSWPNTTVLRSRSSVASLLRSSLDTDCGGMRAILETMCSISPLPMTFFCRERGSRRCAAPASSMTSMALSGRWRSLM
ncbi:Uncharacterised protein [Bordetella pertussis]|nr:Uncharacterised protein [Bordetella pertussis]